MRVEIKNFTDGRDLKYVLPATGILFWETIGGCAPQKQGGNGTELYKRIKAHRAYYIAWLSYIHYVMLLHIHDWDMYSIYNNTEYCVNWKFYISIIRKG